MKKLFLLLALMGMVAVGCSKEQTNEEEGGNENNIPENIFFGLDKESATISADGGSVDVIVYSNYKWEISGTSDWCTPSVKGGDANEDGQKVTFSADVTYDDREAIFWFRCADEKIKFVVSQKLKEVIIPDANNTFNIPVEGSVAVISYQTSVDCKVIIPEEAQDWITIAPASRGLVSENINLDIAENTTYSARTAVIKVVAKDNAELAIEYTINQEQNDAILADENNTFTVPSAGGEVVINYQTNIDCEVIIPEEAQDWITIAPASRGLVSENINLDIAENTTYSARTAVIKVVAKDNAELAVEYTINQEQNNAVLANGNTEFTIDGRGQQITIEHKANVDCDVIIPDDAQSWISLATSTRGLSTYSTTLNIAENNSGKERSCVIKVTSQGDNELFAEYTITQKPRYCLYYTSNDGEIVQPNDSSAFGATILSNTYKDGVGAIDFNATITTIGDYAFVGCDSLTSVTIPDSVTTIGNEAFTGCTSLTSVTIPDSVTTIGNYAFIYCSSLKSVTIADTVTTIGDYAFSDCTSLTRVNIPDSVTKIGSYTFNYCTSLTSVTIGDSVTTIGYYAFRGCSSLTSVTIPDSVTTIGEEAFYWCSSLISVTIGDNVTFIGYQAFFRCESLNKVYCYATIPPSLGSNAFSGNASGRLIYVYEECVEVYKSAWSSYKDSIYTNGRNCPETTTIEYTTKDGNIVTTKNMPVVSNIYDNGVGTLVIGGIITEIPYYAFNSCTNLTSVNIPDSVTTIGNYAFGWCTSLTSVNIPDSVTTIGYGAFTDSNSMTSVNIPDSVTSIGEDAFRSCTSLTSVYCKATTPPALGNVNVFDNNGSGRKIYVPAESLDAYKSATRWSEYADAIVGYNF